MQNTYRNAGSDCATQAQFFSRSKSLPSGFEVNPKVHSPYGNIFPA